MQNNTTRGTCNKKTTLQIKETTRYDAIETANFIINKYLDQIVTICESLHIVPLAILPVFLASWYVTKRAAVCVQNEKNKTIEIWKLIIKSDKHITITPYVNITKYHRAMLNNIISRNLLYSSTDKINILPAAFTLKEK